MNENSLSEPPYCHTLAPIAEEVPRCEILISLENRRVKFASVVVQIELEENHRPLPSEIWYTKQEVSNFQREWKTLTKHYHSLAKRQDAELLGLEDAKTNNARSSQRKFHLQSVLLQQDIHRAIRVEDADAIASLSRSYSKASIQQALERASLHQRKSKEQQDDAIEAFKENPKLASRITSSLSDIPVVVSVQAGKVDKNGQDEDCTTASNFTKAEVTQPDHRSFEKRLTSQWLPNTELPTMRAGIIH